MPFPSNRKIIERVLHERRHEWRFAPDAVERILREIDARVARKPDINMISLMARVVRKHTELKDVMTEPQTDEEWMQLYLAGEWIPHSVIATNDNLRKRMAEHAAVWSVAKNAYRIKSAFEKQE